MGLSHLKERMEAIGGKCVMQSTKGKGTRVEMTVSMTGTASPVMAIGINGLNN
jgi:signal transduction histidine kinase